MPEEKAPPENPAENSGNQSNPSNPSNLGHYKSAESKARALANLHKPFVKGERPPARVGRPPKDGPATRDLRKLLRRKFPGDPAERTYMQLMIEGLVKQAIKGNVYATALVFERLEGRMPLPIEADQPAVINVIVNRNVDRHDIEARKESLLLEADTSSRAND
jgi:hypothetical protein